MRKPINVASVPHRSPFRYPGGKTWFVPYARHWLAHARPNTLIEPFAGGGIIGLTAGFEQLADRVVLVELDHAVAAVWHTVFSRDAGWLAQKIREFCLTRENVIQALSENQRSTKQIAFQTILRNRTQHGGIMCKGAGVMKQGEAGKGVASRWYPETLARRIDDLHRHREHFTFIEGDAITEISKHLDDPGASFFVDPPYTASKKSAGSRLYTHCDIDHSRLFDLMQQASGTFLMTYDEDDTIVQMSLSRQFEVGLVPMKSRQHVIKHEAVISNDLTWYHEPIQSRQKTLF